MKKCPGCGTLSSDQDVSCGVCGRPLTGIEQVSQVEISTVEKPAIKAGLKVDFRALAGLSAGIAMVGVGLYFTLSPLFFPLRLLSLVFISLILFGSIITMATYDITSKRPYGALPFDESEVGVSLDEKYSDRSGRAAVQAEAEREEEEERKIESGEAD